MRFHVGMLLLLCYIDGFTSVSADKVSSSLLQQNTTCSWKNTDQFKVTITDLVCDTESNSNFCSCFLYYNTYKQKGHLSHAKCSSFDIMTDSSVFNSSETPSCDTKITNFNLSCNNISAIADDIFQEFGSVKLLDLSTNLLNVIEIFTFQGLDSLQELYLNMNHIDHVTAGAFSSLSNLEILDLSDNLISSLNIETFLGLLNLRSLYLSGNKLSQPTFDFLLPLISLNVIDLSRNLMTHIDENAVLAGNLSSFVLRQAVSLLYIMEDAFSNCSNLTFIDLSGNLNLAYIDGTSLPESLEMMNVTNTKIKMLNDISNSTVVLADGSVVDKVSCFPAVLLRGLAGNESNSDKNTDDFKYTCGPFIDVDNIRNVSVFVGDRVHAYCYATGKERPRVSWQRGKRWNDTHNSYETICESNVLNMKVTSLDLDGEYTCSATNGNSTVFKTFYINVSHTDVRLRVLASSSRAVVVTWNRTFHVSHHLLLYRAFEETSVYTTQHISDYWKIFRINSLSPNTHYEICIASYMDVSDRACVRTFTSRDHDRSTGIHNNSLAIVVLVTSGLVFAVFLMFTLYRCCRKLQVIAKNSVFIVDGACTRSTFDEVTETTFLYENNYTDLPVDNNDQPVT